MNDDQNRRKDDARPAVLLQWDRPNRWTLLLTGPTYGLVGESGKTWEGHDATYERVNVIELPIGAGVFPERDPSKPAEEQGMFNKFIVLRTDGTDAPGEKHHGCAHFVLDLDHDRHAPAAMRAYAASCSETHQALASDIVAKYGKPILDDSEQYRCQMAGISTAALGYWKEADGVHPEYDTPALRDVARLYAKYDALFQYRQMACDIPHLVRTYTVTEIVDSTDLLDAEKFVKLSDVVALLGASSASDDSAKLLRWLEENSKDYGNHFQVMTGEGTGGLLERARAAMASTVAGWRLVVDQRIPPSAAVLVAGDKPENVGVITGIGMDAAADITAAFSDEGSADRSGLSIEQQRYYAELAAFPQRQMLHAPYLTPAPDAVDAAFTDAVVHGVGAFKVMGDGSTQHVKHDALYPDYVTRQTSKPEGK